MSRDPYKAYMKAQREAMQFAERAHRRQMIGNVLTSWAQSMSTNRPMQVVTAAAVLDAINLVPRKFSATAGFFDALGDTAIKGGLAAYLVNSDGGTSTQFDIPDVESPGGGGAVGGAGAWFLPPTDPRALASSSRRRPRT